MPKKIKFFIGLFVGLGMVALVLFIKGSPKTELDRLFQSVDQEDLSKVRLTSFAGSLTLEQREGRWHLTEPVDDVAHSQAVAGLIDNIMDFSVGSIVSESKKNYPKFGLSTTTARRLQVYIQDRAEPKLDGYFGNQAVGYTSQYFRFADQTPVYMADGIASYVFQRAPSDYRSRDVFGADLDAVMEIFAGSKEGETTLFRSSETWLVNGRPIDKGLGGIIINKLKEMKAVNFENKEPKGDDFGLDKPSAVVQLKTAENQFKTRFGHVKVNKANPDDHFRYAKTEGRDAVLLVSDEKVKDLMNFLHNVVK